MNKEQTLANKSRFEQKFMVAGLTIHEVEAFINLHPALFLEIYHPRFVNNLYLDSPSLNNYFSHVNGQKDRAKVRIRWYGSLFGLVDEPVLELKIKRGSFGRKESFPLAPFKMGKQLQFDSIRELFARSAIPEALRLDLNFLEASLLNRYRRKYFRSADRKYRLTVDSEMVFYQMSGASNSFLGEPIGFVDTILELKYGLQEAGEVERVTNRFPFRMTKNSKYVNGIERAYLW